jgi:hypothetical protein
MPSKKVSGAWKALGSITSFTYLGFMEFSEKLISTVENLK